MVHELGYRDKVIIPDKYNTGVENELALIPIAQKFPDWNGYMVPSTITANGGYVFENLIVSGSISIKSSQINHAIYFKNCKFTGGDDYAIKNSGDWTSGMELHFEFCEFENYSSAAIKPLDKTTLKNCKIHRMPSDGLKGGFSYGGFENCYIYDIGYNNPSAHADGIQTTGANTDLYIKNCRFDVPTTLENVGNAGIFFVQEGNSVDAEIKDVLINGGNYSIYIGIKDGATATITGLTGSNIKIGATYTYGSANIFISEYQNWTTNGTITAQDKLFVSSVFMGTHGKIKVHASNYTESARTLVLVSDIETQTYTVPAHPTAAQTSELTFDDLPYDLEYEVEGNYVICYDTSVSDANEIRFAYATVDQLFTDIADAVRSKTGSQDLIPRQSLPDEISNISGATLGTKSITINGTYNAEDDGLDGYSSVTVSISGLPSNMEIVDIAIETSSSSIDIPYDKTKTVFMIYAYDLDYAESQTSTVTMVTLKKHTTEDTYMGNSTIISGNAGSTDGGAGMTPTFDAENGIINCFCRNDRYFRSGRTYRAIIIYAESNQL